MPILGSRRKRDFGGAEDPVIPPLSRARQRWEVLNGWGWRPAGKLLGVKDELTHVVGEVAGAAEQDGEAVAVGFFGEVFFGDG